MAHPEAPREVLAGSAASAYWPLDPVSDPDESSAWPHAAVQKLKGTHLLMLRLQVRRQRPDQQMSLE
jgi:hypothetical protein